MTASSRTYLLLALAVTLLGCADTKANDAKMSVGLLLADPATAQFSDLSVNGDVVCGLVNSKNLLGAYTGYTGFIVAGGVAQLGDGSPEFFADYLQKCGEPAKSKFRSLDIARTTQRVDALTKALK